MAGIRTNQVAYTETQPLANIPLLPIVAKRNPLVSDKAPLGSTWVNKLTNQAWILTSIQNNSAVWELITNAGGGGGGAIQIFAVQTNDANPHALMSIPVPVNSALNIQGSIIAEGGGYVNQLGGPFNVTFVNSGAGATQVGAFLSQTVDSTGGAVSIDSAAAGNNAEIVVTGQAATVWNWKASVIITVLP